MRKITHLIIYSLLLVMAGCEKDTEPANFAPKLTTGEATNIYRTGATLSGSMEKSEGVVVKEYGILYSISQSMADAIEMKVDAEDGNDFAVQLRTLESGKTYYYCAYAHSGYSTAKGEIRSFTTGASNTPVFSSLDISATDEKSFIASTSILDEGGGNIFLSGFCWKETSAPDYNPTERDETGNIADLSEYKLRVKDLKPGRQYAIRAYAVSSKGIGYGETVYVMTKATDLPVVSSSVRQDSTETSLTLSARILANGAGVTEKGFCYSTEMQEPTVAGLKEIAYTPDTTIYATIEGLKPGNTYYIRAYAMSSQGVGYGDVMTHTVVDNGEQTDFPAVTTLNAERVGSSSAIFTGSIALEDLSSITAFGFVWKSESFPMSTTVIENYPSDKLNLSTGVFFLQLDGLPVGEPIQMYAWADKSVGNEQLRGQGDWIEFTLPMPVQPASVSQAAVDQITVHTASVAAWILDDGGSKITESGFYYSAVHALPDVQDTHIASMGSPGSGTIVAKLTGLEEGQDYYIRGYAVNEAGLSYGEVRQFRTKTIALPTVITDPVSAVTPTSARLSASVTSSGNGTIQRKGFCWSTTHTAPTLEQHDGSWAASTENDSYFYLLTGLLGKTKYYVRAYAENEKGVSYGEVQAFTTGTSATVPTLSGTTVSEISETSARATARIVSDGGAAISAKGFCFSSTDRLPTLESGSVFTDTSAGDAINGTIANLEPDSAYYIRAYAINEEGVAYGDSREFRTALVTVPTVSGLQVTNVTETTFDASAMVDSDGGSAVLARGFCYSTTNQLPTTADQSITSGDTTPAFASAISGLSPETTYYVRAYGENVKGIAYSETYTVKTLSAGPVTPGVDDNEPPVNTRTLKKNR